MSLSLSFFRYVSRSLRVQVVKVAGTNISHKLRLSSVKPSDEGTYECRVIDFSDTRPTQHRVRAHLQVERDGGDDGGGDASPKHPPAAHHTHHKPARELRKRATSGDGEDNTGCAESCTL